MKTFKDNSVPNDGALPILPLNEEDINGIKNEEKNKYKFPGSNPLKDILIYDSPRIIKLPDDFGESKYDKDVLPIELLDLNEVRAQRQTNADKITNSLLKTGVIATTTFADNFLGTAFGIVESLSTLDPSKIIDNTFSRNVTVGLQNWSEKALPNYYTKEELETPWYQNFGSTNFWFDKVIKNTGFMIGAATSGSLFSGMLSSLRGTAALQRSIAGELGRGLAKKIATGQLTDDALKAVMTDLHTKGQLSKTFVDDLIASSKKLRAHTLQNQIASSMFGAAGESRIEAIHSADEFEKEAMMEANKLLRDKEISLEEYNKRVNNIKEYKKSIENLVFGLNFALLSVNNFLQFGDYFTGGYDIQKKTIGNIIREGNKYVPDIPETTFDKVLDIGKKTVLSLKNPLIEGFEEHEQGVVSQGNKKYFMNVLNNGTRGVGSYINTLMDTFIKNTTDPNKWEEAFIGFISGGIGSPVIHGNRVAWGGGVIGDIREQLAINSETKKVAEALNKAIENDAFKNLYFSSSIISDIDEKQKEALLNDDKATWKTLEEQKLAHMINAYYSAGKLEDFISDIESLKEMSAEEIRKNSMVNKKEDENGNTITLETPIDIYEGKTDEEVVKLNREKADKYIEKIKRVKQIREAIDTKFTNALPSIDKGILAADLAVLETIPKREDAIAEEISKINVLLDGRKFSEINRRASSLALKNGYLNTLLNYINRAKKRERYHQGKLSELEKTESELTSEITDYTKLLDPILKEIESINNTLTGNVNLDVEKAKELNARLKTLEKEKEAILGKIEERKKTLDIHTKTKIELTEKRERLAAELEQLLKEEYEARTKKVKEFPQIYENMTFEEYRQKALLLADEIEEFENGARASYERIGENPIDPHRKEKLNKLLSDLHFLSGIRFAIVESYLKKVQLLQKDPKHFEKLRGEVLDELVNRDLDAKLERIKGNTEFKKKGVLLVNIDTGKKVRLNKIGDEYIIKEQDENGNFSKKVDIPINREFAKKYMIESEYQEYIKERQKTQELNKQTAAENLNNTESGFSIVENRLYGKGKIVEVVTKNNKTIQFLNIKGTYYRINERENPETGNKEYTINPKKYFEDDLKKFGEITEIKEIEPQLLQVDGEVIAKGSNYFLTREVYNPLLEAKFRKHEIEQKDETDSDIDLDDISEDVEIPLSDVTDEDIKAITSKENLTEEEKKIHESFNKRTLFITHTFSPRTVKVPVKDDKGNIIKYEEKTVFDKKDITEYKEGDPVTDKFLEEFERINNISLFEAIKNRKKGDPAIKGPDGKYISYPEKSPKKLVLVAKDVYDSKEKKYKWGKPIYITNTQELKNYTIRKNSKGQYYAIRGKKIYFVKYVDWYGFDPALTHYRVSFATVYKQGDKYYANTYGKTAEVLNFDIDSLIEGIDYIKDDEGNFRVFRKFTEDKDTGKFIMEDYSTNFKEKDKSSGYYKNIEFNLTTNQLDDIEIVDKTEHYYVGFDKRGNKMLFPRKKMLYKISSDGNNLFLEKGELAGYSSLVDARYWNPETKGFTDESRNNNQLPNESGFYDHDKEWSEQTKVPFTRGVLFTSTGPFVSNKYGEAGSNLHKSPDFLRFTSYINRNNLHRNHRVLYLLGSQINHPNKEYADHVFMVIAKQADDGSWVPINNNGSFISREEVFEKGVFSSIPRPETFTIEKSDEIKGFYEIGRVTESGFVDRITQPHSNPADLANEIIRYKQVYNYLVEKAKTSPQSFRIKKVTKGSEIVVSTGERFPATNLNQYVASLNRLILTIAKGKEDIKTTDGVTFKGIPGRIYAEDPETGNVFSIEPNKLNEDQINTVIKLLELFVSKFQLNKDGTITIPEKAAKFEDFDIFLDGIKKIVYFQDRDNLTKKGKEELRAIEEEVKKLKAEYLKEPDPRKRKAIEDKEPELLARINKILKDTSKQYLIHTNKKTRFYLSSSNVIPGGYIVFGEHIHKLVKIEDGKVKLNSEIIEPLRQFLAARPMNVMGSELNNNERTPIIVLENGSLTPKKVVYNDHVLNNSTIQVIAEITEHGPVTHIGKKVIIENIELEENKNNNNNTSLNISNFNTQNNNQSAVMPSQLPSSGVLTDEEAERGFEEAMKAGLAGDSLEELQKLGIVIVNPNQQPNIQQSQQSQQPQQSQPQSQPQPVVQRQDPTELFSNTSKEEEQAGNTLQNILGNKKKIGNKERRVWLSNPENYKKEDFKAFENYVRSRFGDRFYEDFVQILPHIANGKWGEIKNGIIRLFSDAELGTGYHELFHKVLEYFVTPEVKAKLIEQAKTDPRFKERIERARLSYSDKTENEIVEEALAEEFRDFVLDNGKSLIQRKQSKLYNLFKTIVRWFKRIMGLDSVNQPNSIDELFNMIENGEFKYSDRVNFELSNKARNKTLEKLGLSIQEEYDAMRGMTSFFFRALFDQNVIEDGLYELFEKDGVSPESLKKVYDAAFEYFIEHKNEAIQLGYNEQQLKVINTILNNKKEFISAHLKYLNKYNLQTSEDFDVLNDENDNGKGDNYNYSSLRVSTKANATGIIRALVGGISETDSEQYYVLSGSLLPIQKDFGKLFNILSNKLANLTTIEEFVKTLRELVPQVPEIRILLKRLRLQDFGDDFNVNMLSFKEFNIIIKFMQTFAKNKNLYEYGIINPDGSYKINDANTDTLLYKVLRNWESRFNKTLNHYEIINGKKIPKVILKNGIYYYNPEYFMSKYGKLRTWQFSPYQETYYQIMDDVGMYDLRGLNIGNNSISLAFYERILAGEQPVIYSRDVKADVDFYGGLRKTARILADSMIDYIENGHFNLNGDYVFGNTVNSSLTLLINDINKIGNLPIEDRLNALLKMLPHLNPNNPGLRNSVVLNQLLTARKFNIELTIQEGNRLQGDDPVSFDDMGEADVLYSWIKNIINNESFPLMRTADNKTQRNLKSDALKAVNLDPFIYYLKDEMELYTVDEYLVYNNFAKNKAQGKGIMLELIKKQNPELFKLALKAINSKQVDEFIEMYRVELLNAIDSGIIEIAVNLQTKAMELGLTDEVLGNINFYDTTIRHSSAYSVARGHLSSTIEQNYILFGSLAFAKSIDDRFKRNSGITGPKNISIIGNKDSVIEIWIRNNLRRVDRAKYNAEQVAKEFYTNDSPIIRTLIFSDVFIRGKFYEEYKKANELKEIAEAYNDPKEESDGYSIIMPDEGREFIFRNGEWSDKMEDLYAWEMQHYMHYRISKETDPAKKKELIRQFEYVFDVPYKLFKGRFVPYKKEKGKIVELRKPSKVVFNSLKPQYFGPIADVNGFVPGMYKTSFMWLLPSMFIDFKTNTVINPNMEKVFETALDKGVGVISFYSAVKGMTVKLADKVDVTVDEKGETRINIPSTSEFNPLYVNGQISDNINAYHTQDIYYKYLGVQVQTGNKTKKTNVFGTQLAKQILNGLFSNGEFTKSESLKQLVERYEEATKKRLAFGLNNLRKKLGIETTEDGKYSYFKNKEEIIRLLREEAIARKMPDYIMDLIDGIEKYDLPLDVIPGNKMETVLMAMVDKITISKKISGKASYQVASTLFEGDKRFAEIESDKAGLRQFVSRDGNTIYTSGALNFYGVETDEKGNIIRVKEAEVFLPSYFEKFVRVGENIDERLLQLIGFRIPTQGLNSVEVIKVKGFISDSLGDVIVVPSEIVVKAGSDFDIDKLNIYIPRYYINERNEPVYIESGKYMDYQKNAIRNAVFKLVSEVFGDNKDLYESVKGLFIDIITELNDKNQEITVKNVAELFEKYKYEIPTITESEVEAVELLLAKLTDEELFDSLIMSEDQFMEAVNDNELIMLLREIAIHPDNARQLLNPIDSGNINELAEEFENYAINNPLLTRVVHDRDSFTTYGDITYHLSIFIRNMDGNGAVGIAANAATFQIYAARYGFKMANSFKVYDHTGAEKTISTRIDLPHNSDNQGRPLLGGIKDALGSRFIYEVMNNVITMTVDNSKNPVLNRLNSGLKTINTALYLMMTGVPMHIVYKFLNQPIMRMYVTNLAKYESKALEAHNQKRTYSDEIVNITINELVEKLSSKVGRKFNVSELGQAALSRDTMFTEEELTDMLDLNAGNFDIKFNETYVKNQIKILKDFIRYQEAAKVIGQAIQGLAYDTKSFGKNLGESIYQIMLTEKIKADGIIINYDKAVEPGNFIGNYKSLMEYVTNNISNLFAFTSNAEVRKGLFSFISRYLTPESKIGRERILNLINVYKQGFVSYVLLSKPIRLNENTSVVLADKIDELFSVKNNTPAHVLVDLLNLLNKGDANQQLNINEQILYEEIASNEFIRLLNPIIMDGVPYVNVNILTKKLDSIEHDRLTDNWRYLLNSNNPVLRKFGYDLIYMTLLQNGIHNSPTNFSHLIPPEILVSIMKSIKANTDNITASEMAQFELQLFINNYENNDLVKKLREPALKKEEVSVNPVINPVVKIYETEEGINYSKKISLLKMGKFPYKRVPGLYLVNQNKKLERLPDTPVSRDFRNKHSLLVYGSKLLASIGGFKFQFNSKLINTLTNPNTQILDESISRKTEVTKQTKTITLKDNQEYPIETLYNTKFLLNLGYTPEEIGKLIKEYLC